MGSPHSDPGARSPCAPWPARGGGAEQESKVDSVDRVPEQVREQGLDAVRTEAREERSDAHVDGLDQRTDQEGHPEGGTDDPEDGAPDDSLDEVVDRGERFERLHEGTNPRMEDKGEVEAPDDPPREMDDASHAQVDVR